MFMFIFISLAFVAGMPLLYPITMLYFEITYKFELISLVKYY